jgi:mycobactin salicyl-AMP ligase
MAWGTAVCALALPADESTRRAPLDDAAWGAIRLSALLATADRHPRRSVFCDQPGRESWSGRPRQEWSYALAATAISRLAGFFVDLGLKPGTAVGICLPAGSEAALTLLAIERAGHRPCLLPVAWSEKDLEEAVAAAGAPAVVTQTRIGEERPAEMFCAIAARSFGLRFLCAYGPSVPDGVVDLDKLIRGPPLEPEPIGAQADPGLITFSRRGGPGVPLLRSSASLAAAAVGCLVAARIAPGERILTLLAQDDLAGLATGLAASLLGGATLELHGLFDAAALSQSLEAGAPTHLVAPGSLGPELAASGLPVSLASIILVHQAPVLFTDATELAGSVVDVLALDEQALLAAPRDGAGRVALMIGDADETRRTAPLLRTRRDEEDGIWLAGPASAVAPFARHGMADATLLAEWRDSGFRAEGFAGLLTGVTAKL